MTRREDQVRREWIRARILSDAWSIAFPTAGLTFLMRTAWLWLVRTSISFGLFACWPTGRPDDPIGFRVGLFAADTERRIVVVGWARFNERDLLRLAGERRRVRVRVIGWLRIVDDVDPALCAGALESVRVLGVSRIAPAARAAIEDRAA